MKFIRNEKLSVYQIGNLIGRKRLKSRFVDIFQGRAPRGVLAKHYTPQGIRLLREIYDKANLKVLE